jgi:hypothetical protein
MYAQLKPLRAIALTLASLAVCSAGMAADPVIVAKAHTATTSPLARAEAEQLGMGYPSFEAVMTEALGKPTAAGHVIQAQRGAVEAVIARTMGGLMP